MPMALAAAAAGAAPTTPRRQSQSPRPCSIQCDITCMTRVVLCVTRELTRHETFSVFETSI